MTGHGHDRTEELLALQVLGGLSEGEQRELDKIRCSTGSCATCDRLEREYREAAAWLAFSLPPLALPPDAERRLLSAVRTAEQGSGGAGVPGPFPASVRRTRPARHAQSKLRNAAAMWRRRLTAVAAGVALLFAGATGGFGVSEMRRPQPPPATTASPAAMTAFLADPDTELVTFSALDARQPSQGRMRLARQDGREQAWIIATALGKPAHGRVYQLWYRSPGADTMHPSATFVPGRNGGVVSRASIGPDVRLLAVTVEPRDGSSTPTTRPITQATVR